MPVVAFIGAGLLLLILTAKRRAAPVAVDRAAGTGVTPAGPPTATVRASRDAPPMNVAPGSVGATIGAALRASATRPVDRFALRNAVRGVVSPQPPAPPTQPVSTPTPTQPPKPTQSPTPPAQPASTPSQPPASDPAMRVLQLTNAARARGATCRDGSGYNAPAPPLVWNATLAEAAKQHSDYMATRGVANVGHDDPLGHIDARASALGYDWSAVAENVAGGQHTPEEVVAAWLASDHGHCRNLMDPGLKELGVAVARGPDGALFWTQDYGTRF